MTRKARERSLDTITLVTDRKMHYSARMQWPQNWVFLQSR
jgi:hypothetical protein